MKINVRPNWIFPIYLQYKLKITDLLILLDIEVPYFKNNVLAVFFEYFLLENLSMKNLS
jgi:hypothetical protein